jgi:hypothetical protein
MLKKMSIPVFYFFLFSITAVAYSGNANFSGEWILDKEKSDLSESPLYLSKITITQKADSVFTTRTYMNEYGEQYPFDEEITLDGEEREIVIYEMKRRTAAHWSEDGKSLLITSKTKYYGDSGEEEFSVEETWSLDEKGMVLSIAFTTNSVYGTNTGTYNYKKADK